ncbi:winged helix-turn-helix domain-containing protein [Plantactinospora mayteni]|uniref:winged helix-turn-helix domain-containing protein n=1 Tax=Plantactinospora mayteni TaxID=566021 RepID=UPI003558945D
MSISESPALLAFSASRRTTLSSPKASTSSSWVIMDIPLSRLRATRRDMATDVTPAAEYYRGHCRVPAIPPCPQPGSRKQVRVGDRCVRRTSYLLHRIGWSVQVSGHRPPERDGAAVTRWRQEAWPAGKR